MENLGENEVVQNELEKLEQRPDQEFSHNLLNSNLNEIDYSFDYSFQQEQQQQLNEASHFTSIVIDNSLDKSEVTEMLEDNVLIQENLHSMHLGSLPPLESFQFNQVPKQQQQEQEIRRNSFNEADLDLPPANRISNFSISPSIFSSSRSTPITGFVFDESMCAHAPLPHSIDDIDHPESPDRLTTIFEALCSSGLLSKCIKVPTRRATPEEIQRAHDSLYLDSLNAIKCNKNIQFEVILFSFFTSNEQ